MIDILTIEHIGIVIGVLLSTIALYNPVKTFFTKMSNIKDRLSLMWDVAPKLVAFNTKLDDIYGQLVTNGGSSLRDAVNRIERKIVLNNEITKDIVRDDPKGKYQTTADGSYEWVNRTYQRLIDKDPTQLYGKGWQSFIVESDRDRVIEEWIDCISTGREFNSTYTIFDDKAMILVQNHARPIMIGGETVAWVGDVLKSTNDA